MKKLWIIIIVLVVIALGAWRIFEVMKTRAQAAKTVEAVPTAIEVEQVRNGSIQDELSLVGNITANSEVNVFPKIAARIEKMMVDEGSIVSQGGVVAKLEDRELSLRVRQAEVALNTVRIAYDQTKALAEIRTRSQVTQAEAGFVSADAAMKQVKDIAQTRVSSQLESAEAGLTALKANLKKIKDGAREEEKKQIEASVLQAKANMDNAQTDLDRIEKLYKEGAVSAQTLDASRTRATIAQAQYEAASQQLKLVETGARPEDILAMESQVRQAESGLEVARSMSLSKSWEQDIDMAQARYDQAKAGLDASKAIEKAKSWEAEIAASEAAVKQAETALELAKEALGYATITAPISGTVSKRNLDTGSMANPAMPLFTIVNVNNVKAIVDVPEASLHRIPKEGRVTISAVGLSAPMSGRITLISPVIKPVSRTASLEISIDNSSRRLRPGSFARVNITLNAKENVTLIRRSAIVEGNNGNEGSYVFVLENDRSVKRKIETGIVKSDVVEVLSGLQVGEKVIISGQNQLKDGDRVKASNNLSQTSKINEEICGQV